MPKRIGFLYEKVITRENCVKAIMEGTKNLKKNQDIRMIRRYPEVMADIMVETFIEGWIPGRVRIKVINEGSQQKTRELRIANPFDHLMHVAIMMPLIPILLKRFDFYCSGSVPERGQKHVDYALKGWTKQKHCFKYGAELDVHHAYQNAQKEIIMYLLGCLVKDKRYLQLHEMMLDQMGGMLAIGFSPSHWYFNWMMTTVDRAVRKACGKKVKYVRFMDNIVMVSNNKRVLKKAVRIVKEQCEALGLELNNTLQVFPTKSRAIQMLSYRYFRGYSILRKSTMYRITKGMKRAGKNPCEHHCRGALSQIGILRHCNSYHYRQKHVYNVVSINRMKGVISSADKKRNLRELAALCACLPCGADQPVQH